MSPGRSRHCARARVGAGYRLRARISHLALGMAMLGCTGAHAARIVTDGTGARITVPDHANRIVCLAPSVADDVFSLGAGDAVIAVSDFTKFPAAAAKEPSIGSPATPSLEKILALHPDLVIATAGINRPDSIALLRQHGIAVFEVDPQGLDGVYASLLQIGDAVGRPRNATTVVAHLKTIEAALRHEGSLRRQQTVFLPLWYDPVISIGGPAYLTQLLDVVGLHSVTSGMKQAWPTVSLESVLAAQPQEILLIDDSGVTLDQLAARPGWKTLEAVREHRVLHVDPRIELPSPACFAALAALAQQLDGGHR